MTKGDEERGRARTKKGNADKRKVKIGIELKVRERTVKERLESEKHRR